VSNLRILLTGILVTLVGIFVTLALGWAEIRMRRKTESRESDVNLLESFTTNAV